MHIETPPDYLEFSGREWHIRSYREGDQWLVVTYYHGIDEQDARKRDAIGTYYFLVKQEAEEKFTHMVSLVIEKSR